MAPWTSPYLTNRNYSAVNLIRSYGSPALTGHYLANMLPQPDLLSVVEHFVVSGRQVLPVTGVADLEPGDLVGVAHSPLLRVPLDNCNTRVV